MLLFSGSDYPKCFRGKFFLSFDFSSQDWLLRIGRDQVRALDVPFWEVVILHFKRMTFIGGMAIQPSIGNPFNGYINPYYWVDEFIHGNLDPSTYTNE